MLYNPDDECRKLIQRIKQFCKLAGMSIHAAADKAELASSTLNELINEKSKPQVYTLFKICNALEISISDLLLEETDEVSINERKQLFSYRHLPSWKQEKVEEYVEMLLQYELSEKR